MRVDVEATKWAWRQTVWGTGLAALILCALIIYFLVKSPPDYSAVQTLLLFLLVMPLMLGVAYLIRRFIESLAR